MIMIWHISHTHTHTFDGGIMFCNWMVDTKSIKDIAYCKVYQVSCISADVMRFCQSINIM